MLPKKSRLSRLDFATISKTPARNYRGALFSLKVVLSPTAIGLTQIYFSRVFTLSTGAPTPTRQVNLRRSYAISKYTVVTPGALARRAVDRNRVKRRVMSVIEHLPNPAHKGALFIFYTQKPAVAATYREIKADITILLERAAMLQ